jgi:hypothetical protein
MFAGCNVYLFKDVFVGLRWDLASYNWLNQASKDKFTDRGKSYTPGPFMGMAFSFIAGFNANLADRWNMKVYWQAGMHNYKISNGSFTLWNYSKNDSGKEDVREGFFNYIQSFMITLEYQLTD